MQIYGIKIFKAFGSNNVASQPPTVKDISFLGVPIQKLFPKLLNLPRYYRNIEDVKNLNFTFILETSTHQG